MQQSIPYKPTAADFMEMWRHLNLMAHESGIVKSALERHDFDNSDWLHYYLFRNNFQVVGQSLLEYCLREMLDIAATDQFSDFDLTGYALEPEEACHRGEGTAVRQALMEEDVFQLLSLYSEAEIKQKLPAFVDAVGSLKVLVIPGVEIQSAYGMLHQIEQVLFNCKLDGEYIVLMGRVTPNKEVSWFYRIYSDEGATDMVAM